MQVENKKGGDAPPLAPPRRGGELRWRPLILAFSPTGRRERGGSLPLAPPVKIGRGELEEAN